MVKRFVAVVLGLLLVSVVPAATMAHGKAARETDMARTVRSILAESKDPRTVAKSLSQYGARFAGYAEKTVTFVYDGKTVAPARTVSTTMGPDFSATVTGTSPDATVRPMAGEKADLTVTMWLYEWRNWDGTYTEQAVISGHWSATEYSWIDDPNDVIDVRWIVGDLVYLSSSPYDGVQRDQHTNGIASYTVNDQIADWDLFVNFRPSSSAVYGRWTNVFVNYTQV
jgi:hypothetical protein